MQQQPQVNFPPPLPPGQNRGVFAAPLPHEQPPKMFGVPGRQAPKDGSKLDPIESVNILIRFVAVLMIFIATVIVGATKYVPSLNNRGQTEEAQSYDELPRRYSSSYRRPSPRYGAYRYNSDYSSPPPPEDYPFPLMLGSLSPIKYFLAANSIVLIYTVATLGISVFSMLMMNQQMNQQQGEGVGVVNDTLKNKLIMLFVVGDLVMVVFLFSAVGSIAASKDAFNSKSDFPGSDKICVSRGLNEFCQKWTAGIVMSMFGAIAYLLLQPLSVFSLTKVNAAADNNN